MIYYDKKHLLEIIQAFYTLTGIRVGLLYTNTQEFFAYPDERSLFCTIVRADPEINKKCINCDLSHMEQCKKMNTSLVYTCHLGLTEVIAPLKENDTIICYFMFGQIIIDEFKEQSRLIIHNSIKEAGFDDMAIEKAIENINCVSSSKLKASIKVFEAIIMQIISTNLIKFTRMDFINHLNSFIDEHISEKIIVKDIYRYFQISRSSLYEYLKTYLDCGLSDYILNRKINYTKNLLINSKIKIGELSEKAGFSDYNYFSRVFRKKTGVSPRAFRQDKDEQEHQYVKLNS